MSDLDTLRDQVEDLLKDAGNALWSEGELEQALRLALAEWSALLPARAVATLDAVDGQREVDLSNISGLLGVVEVWYPYDAFDVHYRRPRPVRWRMLDDATLYLDVEDEPDARYGVRIFYDCTHTLQGLDDATVTSLAAPDRAALVLGAAGYAALARARESISQVSVGLDEAPRYQAWGQARLQEFVQQAYALGQVDSASSDARVGAWRADKWDRG